MHELLDEELPEELELLLDELELLDEVVDVELLSGEVLSLPQEFTNGAIVAIPKAAKPLFKNDFLSIILCVLIDN